jgi:alpha-galactosidase
MQPVVLTYGEIELEIAVEDDQPPSLARFAAAGVDAVFDGPPVPLTELQSPAYGHTQPNLRLSGTLLGNRLRYVSHRPIPQGYVLQLADPESGLEVALRLVSVAPATLSATTTVRNGGTEPQVVSALTSLNVPVTGLIDGSRTDAETTEVLDGRGDWTGENRWHRQPARELLADLQLSDGVQPKGAHRWVSTGTWSTADALPVGAIAATEARWALAWQIEHNGAWRAELAERAGSPGGRGRLQLSLSGPTDIDHGWLSALPPGSEFTSVPVTIAIGEDVWSAVAALTTYRRTARRAHPDNARPTLIYNDYMNTLNGDPTTARLLPLFGDAGAAGAEVFCIDAGWYDDSSGWWDGVGEWRPSTTRFPGGLDEVLQAIRDAGMTPGVWLEPEVVGVRSPVADSLPAEAFFQRAGVRVREAGRYHLDLRHPAARAHLDEVVDRLVTGHGVGYFKLDYNINPGPGTDHAADSVGAGLLAHNRAHLDWLDAVLDRHPGLIIENCASGAMRMDFAMLSRLQLQSTTDQENPSAYAPISVAAPMMVLPEQAGSWAYPNVEMDDEETAYVLSLGLLGRLYLSGFLDRLRDGQRRLVQQAVSTYKEIRDSIPRRIPTWPSGFPGWNDPWLSLALRGEDDTLVTVFRRPGASPHAALELPGYRRRDLLVETVFPTVSPTGLPAWESAWDPDTGTLWIVGSSDGLAARTFRLTPSGLR